jgi:hypothetical protein
MTEHEIAQRGLEARQVLDNPAYAVAMAAIRERIAMDWAACDLRDTERQRLLLQMRKVADVFEAALSGLIEGGKLAHARLDLDELRGEGPARKLLRKVL